jgi:hypothetical protein
MTSAFKSRLLFLKILKIDVLEILRLALYAMIDMPKTSNIQKISQTKQQIEEFQYDVVMAR